MKIKAILFIGAIALGTLSFTFSTGNSSHKTNQKANISHQTEPIGGFVADDFVK